MNRTAKKLLQKYTVVDGHNHILLEIAKRRNKGENAVFLNHYANSFRQTGINVIMTTVGGDHFGLTDNTDLLLWGSISMLDKLYEEADESGEVMAICRNSQEIENALKQGKIAVLLTMEGARPIEGKPHDMTLAVLRNFYRLGLRGLQLVDNGRNRLCDGKGEIRTKGGLTNFGISVVKEMNRLGMVIDVAHIIEPGFWDVLEISEDPVIDSHSNCWSVCDHQRNLKDEQIKALAKKGGVIGLSSHSAMTSKESDNPTIADLLNHLDHIVKLVGIDHVGLGPDLLEPHNMPMTMKEGFLEGVFYTARESLYIENFSGSGPLDIPVFMELFTKGMIQRGYNDDEISKVLGLNWIRVYKQIIG